jgi:hypothetical protein
MHIPLSQRLRFQKTSRPLPTTIEKGKIDDYEMQEAEAVKSKWGANLKKRE